MIGIDGSHAKAYAAGVFDADGTCGVYTSYKIVIAIGMQDIELLEWFREKWGGRIYLHGRVWRWEIIRKEEKIAFIKDIKTFSQTKLPQLELLQQVLEKTSSLSENEIRDQMRALNRRHTKAGPWASTESKGGQ